MSKKFFTICAIALFAFNVPAQSQSINWQKDYNEALRLSRETGKPILIDFWAKWCKPCLVMDEQFWTRADVVEAVKSFVPLKIDYDAEKTLVSQFVVRGLPYIAFSDPYGNLVAFQMGYGKFSAEDLSRTAREMPKDFSILSKAFEAIEQNKSDGAALLEIADYYNRNKMPLAAEKYYKLAYDTPHLKQNDGKKEAVAARLAPMFYANGNYHLYIAISEDYLKTLPKGSERETFYFILINGYINLKKTMAAEIYLERASKEFPDSDKIKRAARTFEMAKKEKVKLTK